MSLSLFVKDTVNNHKRYFLSIKKMNLFSLFFIKVVDIFIALV